MSLISASRRDVPSAIDDESAMGYTEVSAAIQQAEREVERNCTALT